MQGITNQQDAHSIKPKLTDNDCLSDSKSCEGKMKFAECAELILREYSNGLPMHYKKITEIGLEKGILKTNGKTPEATMISHLGRIIREAKERGEIAKFTSHKDGYFSLSEKIELGLASEIKKHNVSVREKMKEKLLSLHPKNFEKFIYLLMQSMGFESCEATQYSKDGGVDVRCTMVFANTIRTKMAIQVKRWKGNVQSQEVQKLRGSLEDYEQGLIITTSDFSSGARGEACKQNVKPIGLINCEELLDLIQEKSLGLRKESISILDIDEEFFTMNELSN